MQNKRLLERYNAYKLEWLHDSIRFIVFIVVFFVVFRFVIGFSIVRGESMEPQLSDGNLVLYFRMVGEYRPGDVVSLRVPSGDYYVKRVVALGGDEVDLRDGRVYVNGEPLEDGWAMGETFERSISVAYPYRVRQGNVFVLGDNRPMSLDSRSFGEVNRRQIKGKILLRLEGGRVERVGDGLRAMPVEDVYGIEAVRDGGLGPEAVEETGSGAAEDVPADVYGLETVQDEEFGPEAVQETESGTEPERDGEPGAESPQEDESETEEDSPEEQTFWIGGPENDIE